MEIEIDSKKNNPLINRTEVHFTIRHKGESTPNREIVRSELAEKLNVKKEDVVVDNIHTSFGVQQIKGYAKIYNTVENAKGWERSHILERNKLIEKKAKKEGEKKVAEKPEGKPAAEKPPKKEESPAKELPKEKVDAPAKHAEKLHAKEEPAKSEKPAEKKE
jgi:small subunit ribosomal protein S24e